MDQVRQAAALPLVRKRVALSVLEERVRGRWSLRRHRSVLWHGADGAEVRSSKSGAGRIAMPARVIVDQGGSSHNSL